MKKQRTEDTDTGEDNDEGTATNTSGAVEACDTAVGASSVAGVSPARRGVEAAPPPPKPDKSQRMD